jgi:hypothetical protein
VRFQYHGHHQLEFFNVGHFHNILKFQIWSDKAFVHQGFHGEKVIQEGLQSLDALSLSNVNQGEGVVNLTGEGLNLKGSELVPFGNLVLGESFTSEIKIIRSIGIKAPHYNLKGAS